MRDHEKVYQLTGEVYSRKCTGYLYFPTKCGTLLLWRPSSGCMAVSSWGSNIEVFIKNHYTRYEMTIPMNNIKIPYGVVG